MDNKTHHALVQKAQQNINTQQQVERHLQDRHVPLLHPHLLLVPRQGGLHLLLHLLRLPVHRQGGPHPLLLLLPAQIPQRSPPHRQDARPPSSPNLNPKHNLSRLSTAAPPPPRHRAPSRSPRCHLLPASVPTSSH